MGDMFSDDPVEEELEPEVIEAQVVEVLAPLPAISAQPAKAALIRFETEVKLWEQRAAGITVITDDVTNKTAAEYALKAKKVLKIVDDLEEYYKRPHLDYNRAVLNFAKPLKEPLQRIVSTMGSLQGNYRLFQENEARKKKAAEEREARERQKKLDEEAKAAAAKGEEYVPVQVPAPVQEPLKTVVHTASGTASQVKHWKYEIVDESLLERDCLEPSDKKIKELIKGGVREKPGLRIYEDYDPRYRL